jgi:hypothetical protein
MEKYNFPNIDIFKSFKNTFENNYQNIQNRGFLRDIHLEQFLKFFDIDKNFKVYLFDKLIADQKKFFSIYVITLELKKLIQEFATTSKTRTIMRLFQKQILNFISILQKIN